MTFIQNGFSNVYFFCGFNSSCVSPNKPGLLKLKGRVPVIVTISKDLSSTFDPCPGVEVGGPRGRQQRCHVKKNQLVISLLKSNPECTVPSRKALGAITAVLGVRQPEIEPTTCSSRVKHFNSKSLGQTKCTA